MRAILSVSDREGIVELAKGLTEAGVECYATDGTRAHLAEAGVVVKAVSELTDAPEILGGRVNTLHPKIFAGLLAPLPAGTTSRSSRARIDLLDLVRGQPLPFAEAATRPIPRSTRRSSRSTSARGPAAGCGPRLPGVAAVRPDPVTHRLIRDIKAQARSAPNPQSWRRRRSP